MGMQDGRLSFGVLSISGASAGELQTEVLNVVLPRSPEEVCLLAPSNNLTASMTIACLTLGSMWDLMIMFLCVGCFGSCKQWNYY